MTTEEALRDLKTASDAVRKSATGNSGAGAEKRYGTAYQAAVSAGAKPQLRKRYRG